MTRINFPLILFSIFLLLINAGCSKTPDGCDRFSDWKTISEKDKEEVCVYQQIYLFKGEYFTVCECCVCDKAPMAMDCNNEPLCEVTEGCMVDFFKKANYLYSAVEESTTPVENPNSTAIDSCIVVEDKCDRFRNWKTISEEDKAETCEYQQIYLYECRYYSVCECCVCNKVPMAYDCNEEPLCDLTKDCMDNFYKHAEYLYSAIEDTCIVVEDECERFADWKIITAEDEVCEYQQIYLYDCKYYAVCECCLCFKAPMAMDCNDEPLCEEGEGCMVDFFDKAEFQYNAIGDTHHTLKDTCITIENTCERFADWVTIPEEVKAQVCEYQQIYLYECKYYTVCECCVCDKVPMAYDCNAEPLCELWEDCMTSFFEKAEYVYSAIESTNDVLRNLCDRFIDWELIPKDEIDDFCEYQQIYLYQGKYYTVTLCCTCDEEFMAIDCNNDPLCDITDDCMLDFYESAVYLFSALEE